MSAPKLFKIKCSQKQYFLHSSDGTAGEIRLLLTDGLNTYEGKVSQHDLSSGKKDLHIDDYEVQSKNALTGIGTDDFEYDIRNCEGGSFEFVWKKIVEQDQIKFQLGSTLLHPVADAGMAISNLLGHLVQSSNDQHKQLAEIKAERDRLADEHSTALTKLESCVSIKEETEQQLYAKFVVVLNDKKAKIRQLKAQVEALQTCAVDRASSLSTDDKHRKSEGDGRMRGNSLTSEENMSGVDDDENAPLTHCSTSVTSSKTAKGCMPLVEQMLNDAAGDDDADLPVVPKRADARKEPPLEVKVPSKNSSSIPRMLSTTGTTNTATTSSEAQRWRDKPAAKKDQKDQSASPKRDSGTRSADLDELIGDMA